MTPKSVCKKLTMFPLWANGLRQHHHPYPGIDKFWKGLVWIEKAFLVVLQLDLLLHSAFVPTKFRMIFLRKPFVMNGVDGKELKSIVFFFGHVFRRNLLKLGYSLRLISPIVLREVSSGIIVLNSKKWSHFLIGFISALSIITLWLLLFSVLIPLLSSIIFL